MPRARVGAVSVVVAAVFLGVACGGGGGGAGSGPPIYSGTAHSMAALDGWARTDLTYSALGSSPPHAGDLDATAMGLTARAFYTFDFGGLSPTAEIVRAEVRVVVTAAHGDPHAVHGDLIAEFFPYGNDLANVFTSTIVGAPPPATFSPATLSPGTRRADVTEMMRIQVEGGASTLQVKVSFGSGIAVVNGVSDYLELTDAENVAGVGNPPTLVFEYLDP